MRRLEEIDENFKIETNLGKDDINFHSVFDKPFKVYGLTYENGVHRVLEV